jgi:hypothetical protein
MFLVAIFFRLQKIWNFVDLERVYLISNTRILVNSIFTIKYLLKDKDRTVPRSISGRCPTKSNN